MTNSYRGMRWRKARRAALERDNEQCQRCGSKQNLHAHHIIPVSDFDDPDDAHYRENLVILCPRCHNAVEGDRQWPETNNIETEDGISHIANLLALRTVGRVATGMAIPEIMMQYLWSYPYVCTCCFKHLTGHDLSNWNPLEPYYQSLYRIVVRDTSLATNEKNPIRREYNFCEKCISEGSLEGTSRGFRIFATHNLINILREFGFNSAFAPFCKFGYLIHGMRTDLFRRSYKGRTNFPRDIQIGLAAAFGQNCQPPEDTEMIIDAFDNIVDEAQSDKSKPDSERRSAYPNWFRGGLSGPYNPEANSDTD